VPGPKHILTRGIGLAPGGLAYLLRRGLSAPAAAPAVTASLTLTAVTSETAMVAAAGAGELTVRTNAAAGVTLRVR
jgi:hypothetical protein